MENIRMIEAYISSCDTTFDITADILALDADSVRHIVKEWNNRFIEPGEGWPFLIEPEEPMLLLDCGSNVHLEFKRSILSFFSIGSLQELTDEMIREAASTHNPEISIKLQADKSVRRILGELLRRMSQLDDETRTQIANALINSILAMQSSDDARVKTRRAFICTIQDAHG